MWHGIFLRKLLWANRDEENSRKTLWTAAKVAAISENAFLWVFETLESNRCRLLKYSQRNYSVVQKLVCDLWLKNEFFKVAKMFFTRLLAVVFNDNSQDFPKSVFVGQLSTFAGVVQQWWQLCTSIFFHVHLSLFENAPSMSKKHRHDIWRRHQTLASRKLQVSREKNLLRELKLLWLC